MDTSITKPYSCTHTRKMHGTASLNVTGIINRSGRKEKPISYNNYYKYNYKD